LGTNEGKILFIILFLVRIWSLSLSWKEP